MRKSILFVFIFLIFTSFIIGCEKNNLIGSWVSEAYSGAYSYTFNGDKTGIYDASGTEMNFTYTVDDNKISILYSGNTEPIELTYKIDDDLLQITDSSGKNTNYKRK